MDRIILSGRSIPVDIVYKNIRHTYLRIKPNKTIYITTSKRTNFSSIEALIQSNEAKILKTIDKISEPLLPLMSDHILYFGMLYPAVHNPLLKKSWIFENQIFYYKNESHKLSALKAFYAKSVIEQSLQLIEKWRPLLKEDIKFDHIIIKSRWMKSQFGSCQSAKKIINMNSVLARFDSRYLETILIHELVHLRVQNHGNNFYDLLYKYLPTYDSLRKELGHLFKRIEV